MESLDLYGLVGDDVILYNRIMGTFYKNMTKIFNSSSTKCRVSINDIKLKSSRNCYISIKNNCYVNSSIGLSILFTSIIDNLEFINNDTRLRLEKNLGVTLTKDKDQSDKGFLRKCNISSETTNDIFIKTLFIKNCNSDLPLEFSFTNTGDSNANCGVVTLLNALSKKDQEPLSEPKLNKIFGLTMTDFIYILIIFIFTIILLLPMYSSASGLKRFRFKIFLKESHIS